MNFKKVAKFDRAVGMGMTYKSRSLPVEVQNQKVGEKLLTNKLEQQILHIIEVLEKHAK